MNTLHSNTCSGESPLVPQLPAGGHSCTGCALCESVCAQGAIRMIIDNDGFIAPVVDPKLCTHCHACEKLCSRLSGQVPPDSSVTQYYEAWLLDSDTRKKSSSGGIVSPICRWILNQGGYIFGVSMERTYQPKYICISNEDDLHSIRGSKYLQADTSNCFTQIREKLKEGKPVLFIGVACQVKALRVRFGYKHKNLYAIDIACYGVPSRKLFNAWLREFPSNGASIAKIDFRNKNLGWRQYQVSLLHDSGETEFLTRHNNPFMRSYLSGAVLNLSCYECRTAPEQRPGDLSLGDYWGHPGDSQIDKLGVSSVICHTEKGTQILQAISDVVHLSAISKADILRHNDGFANPPRTIPEAREHILKELETCTASELCSRWLVKRQVQIRPFYQFGKHLFIIPSFIYKKFKFLFK